MPEDNFTTEKLRKFKLGSEMFIATHGDVGISHFGWRLDLVTIVLPDSCIGKSPKEILPFAELRHYRNVG